MNTNNYRRMMFLPVLIIVAEMYIIGYSGLDKNNDVYETVEDGVLYTTGELDSTVYDEPAAETENADKTAEGTSDSAAAASANACVASTTRICTTRAGWARCWPARALTASSWATIRWRRRAPSTASPNARICSPSWPVANGRRARSVRGASICC